MSRLQLLLQILLFSIFPLRFLIQWLPILGYPIVATFLTFLEYTALILLMIHSIKYKRDAKSKRTLLYFQLLYWIYSIYLIYYIFINPLLPRDIMQHVPLNDLDIIQNIISISIFCSVITLYQHIIDYTFFLKISTLFLTALLIIHADTGNLTIYMSQKIADGIDENDVNRRLELLMSHHMLDGISLAKYASMSFVFNLFLKNSWSRNPFWNKLFFWGVMYISLYNVVITTQRGPLLFLFTTVIIYYYCKKVIGPIATIIIIISTFVFYQLSDFIIPWLASHVPQTFERFFHIVDEGASGRFGSKNSEYALALKQIFNEPFLGTYFRTLYVPCEGHYPHNFILELLMTFGVIFTIPFFLLFFKAVRRAIMALRFNWDVAPMGLIFIYLFSTHLSSDSIAFDTATWVSMAMALFFKQRIPR